MTFGNLINSLGGAAGGDPSEFFATFDSFVLNIVYLAIAAFVGGYLRNTLFITVGYMQADKIRKEYLTSIFRQEMGWVDTRKTGELTTRLARYTGFMLFLLFQASHILPPYPT